MLARIKKNTCCKQDDTIHDYKTLHIQCGSSAKLNLDNQH